MISDDQAKDLLLYASGELDPEAVRRVEDWLRRDMEAQQYLAELDGLAQGIKAMPDPELEVSAVQRIVNTEAIRARMTRWRSRQRGALALAACLAILFIARSGIGMLERAELSEPTLSREERNPQQQGGFFARYAAGKETRTRAAVRRVRSFRAKYNSV